MADFTEDDIIVLAASLMALIAGLVIHSFIIVVNVNDWLKERSMTPVDKVVISLGISRMGNQCAITVYLLAVRLFLYNVNSLVTQMIIDIVYEYFIYANFWLTSLLSIVFCLKISTLRTRLFLYLRRMIDRRIAHCIVALVLFSTIYCLFPIFTLLTQETKGKTYNTTMENQLTGCIGTNLIYSHIIGSVIPLLFCCISSVLLFFSLYHHVTKMKMSGNLSINLETYYSAMRFVSISFIYNIIYFTGHVVCVLYYYLYCINVTHLPIAVGFVPALHSSYLIYRTAKLRSHMSKVLHNVIDCFFQRKDPETKEEVEVAAL